MTLWIQFVIACFDSKGRLRSSNTLKIVVGTWVVSVLADDRWIVTPLRGFAELYVVMVVYDCSLLLPFLY